MSRRTGRSTQIVDRCVQEFFTTGKTYLYDHTREQSETTRLFSIFQERLKTEHPHAQYTYHEDIIDGIYCYKIEIHDL